MGTHYHAPVAEGCSQLFVCPSHQQHLDQRCDVFIVKVERRRGGRRMVRGGMKVGGKEREGRGKKRADSVYPTNTVSIRYGNSHIPLVS